MHVAFELLLCSTVVYVGMSQTLPTVLPHTETVAPAKIQKCTLEDRIAFISTLPNASECGTSLATVFTPLANNTAALANALENVCTNDCGGIYANYLKSTCDDEVGAETLQLYCTPTNGSAALGSYCRYATGDFVSASLRGNLSFCNESEVCSPSCRRAIMTFKAQVGCCYQNAYNNSEYNKQLLNAGYITPSVFAGLEKLNNPGRNPWTLCIIKPPQKCGPPKLRPPAPTVCTLEDQVAFILSHPNAAVCGPSLTAVFIPPANNSAALRNALDNVCTNDCGGVYSNFLKSTCNDQLGAESLRIYCTPTNASAAVGNYCRFAAGDILNSSLFDDLFLCYTGANDSSCSPGCRAALLRLKRQIGCCYQNVYNNTMYNRELLNAGFLTPSEFTGLQQLNNPYVNPWTLCEIEPPKICGPPSFKPPAPPKCTLDDQVAFVSSHPNAAVCGPSLTTVFIPPANNSAALRNSLDNVCTNDCGGVYSNFLKTACNDPLGTESLRIYCTPTNGSAAVGNYCRYAAGDILSSLLLDDLYLCYNGTNDSSCSPGCRAALLRLNHQVGCCYQNVYNNTMYNRELLNAGFLTPSEFTGLQQLNNPYVNPWTLCEIAPPKKCTPPSFKPPAPPKCMLDDQIAFVSSYPNAAVCGPSIATVFTPPTKNSTALSNALDNVCTNDCGGVYSNFLKTACNDPLGAESLRIYCTPNNGSAAVGNYCRYAAEDILNSSLLNNLHLCYTGTNNSSCSPGCRAALLRLKRQVGCCYQNVYNNTMYNRELLNAGFIAPSEFTGLQQLNNPVTNPWTLCEIEPPKKCGPPSFKPPAPPKCTLDDQVAFVSSHPNAAVCGPSLTTVFIPPENNSAALRNALDNVCTNDCGGVYSNFLKSTCNDQLGAESLRIYCTPTNASAAVGNYCRFAAGDILNSSLLNDLHLCHTGTSNSSCSPGCRAALLRLKRQVGCCYQNVYNNTMYNRELLNAGFLTPSEFTGLQQLNNPYVNPWTLCEIAPPKKCTPPSFKPPAPPKCTLDDQIAFVSSYPNAAVCGPSIATVFIPPTKNSTALSNALDNVCTNDCGGVYSNFLKTACNDPLGAESLRIYCTPTNGSAAVGNYCRYAAGDILNSSLLDDLHLCYTGTNNSSCSPGCRAALLRLKHQVGCCYQNVYNNTMYNRELLNAGFIAPSEFTGLQALNNPVTNPWTLCNIEPPKTCSAPLFKPPSPSNCTLNDQIAFFSSLPNAAVCGPSIGTIFNPPPNNSVALTKALMNVCNVSECGGVYSNFLKSTCNDLLSAENLRVFCVPTNGTDTFFPVPYCRFAANVDISYFDSFPCINSSRLGTNCAPECRDALLRIKAEVGCCYQDLYNNTLFSREQLLAGHLTPVVFTEFQLLNDPVSNPWKVCNVTPPRSCRQPHPDGCPRGTYRRNRTCERCPANTNITLSGGNGTVCPCLEGFFRTNQEGPSMRCSAPPSACRNIQAIQRTSTQITLRWKKPDTVGRNDFYYQIEYSDKETAGQHTLESSEVYIQEVITGLKPDTSYKFTVTVNNGVSDQDKRNEKLRNCELTTRTMEGRSSPPHDVQGFCSVVTWRMPRNPNGKITGFDVRLINRPGVMMSTGSDGTFLAVEKEYQQIGTLVQVRAKTSAGAGNWSEQIPLGCEEMATGTCPPCDCPITDQPPQGIHFTIGDQVYGNNSVVSLLSIGEGETHALICRTDNTNCCGTIPNRFGQFYYPNGVQIPVMSAGQGFYRNRGNQMIRLNRREGVASPAGKYRCEIPDASGEMQNIYVTLTTS